MLFRSNSFREGFIKDGLYYMGLDLPATVPEYYCCILTSLDELSIRNREEWKLHMATIIGILAAEDL